MAEPIGLPPLFPGLPGGMNALSKAGSAAKQQAASEVGGASRADRKDFADFLVNSLDEVDALKREADLGIERLMTGETDNVAEVISSVRKAEIAFSMLMEIRNKLLDAYGEIRQMQI